MYIAYADGAKKMCELSLRRECRNYSPRYAGWGEEWLCGEHSAEVGEASPAVGLGSADDGAEGGIGLDTPIRPEPVGHLAEHDGPQVSLGDVVGVRHLAVGNGDEEMGAISLKKSSRFLKIG